MSITHWPANRRKLHRGLPKSKSRTLLGPGTRRLRFEVLETRALLDAGGGLLPGPDAGEPIDPGGAPSWTIVPGKVLVGLRTDGQETGGKKREKARNGDRSEWHCRNHVCAQAGL